MHLMPALGPAQPFFSAPRAAPSCPPGRTDLVDVGVEASVENDLIVVVEPRTLLRQCMIESFKALAGSTRVEGYASLDQWSKTRPQWPSPPLVVVCSPELANQCLEQLTRAADPSSSPVQLVVLADNDEPRAIMEALGRGVRGYIPTSTKLVVAIAALLLVKAGGLFAPADRMIPGRTGRSDVGGARSGAPDLFTPRQTAILQCIRRGKPNKIIAYELAMQESTVKVHLRNIMKKLNATNRTEVAFMLEQMERHAT